MKAKNSVFDADGNLLLEGDAVTLIEVPSELLSGLLKEDQVDIQSQVGLTMQIQEFDDYGNAELEFESKDGMVHFIWVNPLCLRKATG